MLKSTHRPVAGHQPLPPGWTEHKAPTGHPYYHHAETKRSTYTRPSITIADLLTPQASLPHNANSPITNVASGQPHYSGLHHLDIGARKGSHNGAFGGGKPGHYRRPPLEDRPKSKHVIPECSPWLLVKTRLGRRFVYNPEENKSYWKFPPDVMKHVIEYDRVERERRERRERGELSNEGDEENVKHEDAEFAAPTAESMPTSRPTSTKRHDDSDEYEEVEVTDDEADDGPSKRQKLGAEQEGAPVEFNEDDMAYQLAAMGADYGLDPGEYDDGQAEDWEEGAEGLTLTEEDSHALFKDMLNDFNVDPYALWERLIEEGRIIEDERYTCLPNMKSRKEVWGEWSKARIQQLKEQREKQEKKDPRIPYLMFLQKYATPKLYWPEFRRKYKKEPELRDTKVTDKDREKWYREYINRLKLPESTLKSDLTNLLKSLPIQVLNRSTSIEALPPALLTDIRYISLRSSVRDPIIEAYISMCPPAPDDFGASLEEQADITRQKLERERREKALAERARQVEAEKRKQQATLRHGKDVLREGEEEIKRAMQIGREGLLSHMQVDEESTAPQASVDEQPTS